MTPSQRNESESSSKLALNYSSWYGGKMEMIPRVPIRHLSDFSIYYTPGVAAVSRAIHERPDLAFEYTNRWNTIAIVTDGSRVLGLGNIGPEASLPVMEGKALIFKYLGGVDAFPHPIRVQDVEEFVTAVETMEPAFGGINLEDISSPKCFEILERLRNRLEIPVWHDDQQGTAGVTYAALVNALHLTRRKLRSTRIVFFGSGAANLAAARLVIHAGCDPGDMFLVDTKGILHPERADMDQLLLKNRWKYDLAIRTNRERIAGGLREALKGADVLIAASKPDPTLVKPEWVTSMNSDPIVFALANPVPEIWPRDAAKAGAKIVATGRSDFANQVNNSLLFPAVFRGILDVRGRTVTDDMVVVAAEALAKFARDRGLREDYIIPTMEEWEVFPHVARAIGEKAVELDLARKKMSGSEIYEHALAMIKRARNSLKALVEAGLIAEPPNGGN